MPDPQGPKAHEHPIRQRVPLRRDPDADSSKSLVGTQAGSLAARYAELAVTTNFTFLTGGSHPDEMVRRAAELNYEAIGIADHNTLGGVVRAHVAARELGVRIAVGCRLIFTDVDWYSLLVYPTRRDAYARLCRLLTLGKRRAPKGACHLLRSDLESIGSDMQGVVLADRLPESAADELRFLRECLGAGGLSLAITRLYGDRDAERTLHREALGRATRTPLTVVNDVHYHEPSRRALQDVLTCIRHGCTLEEAGFRLFPNAERHLKSPAEMARLFAGHPAALERSVEIAAGAARFSLDELRYEYPDECPAGVSAMEHLRALTRVGATERYPHGLPDKVARQIEHEFSLIEELNYAPYFLTVHDIVRFARGRGILCQGRGAAANSAVCYCLGVTSVDPDRIDILFERFVSRERCEPPDIDIDFEHERREEVIQYLYQKYGRDRAGLTAEIISYRSRSAVREVGKVLGLSPDTLDRIAKGIQWWDEESPPAVRSEPRQVPPSEEWSPGMPDRDRTDIDSPDQEAAGRGGEDDPGPGERTVALMKLLCGQIAGFPRHRSQHVGGFVITRGPLSDLTPIENAAMDDRTVIEWDKDDIEAMNMLKVDVLGLGMLTCIRKALDLIEAHHGPRLTLATIPAEDPAVYDMICAADTLGVFQIESRAQMTMLPRLRPRCFYDLVIEVAIVRPGPIVGDMVHPFLRRRHGLEPVVYPDEKIERVLGKTLGVPLFQEQAMALAVAAAGFTPGEAEMLRRTISAWKSRGNDAIPRYRTRFIEGMTQRGYERTFAEQCFERLKGFSEYGFPESHSASFALLVYASSWIKCYYPAAFAAALINSQPMGFYAPAQIVRDARVHGVGTRPIDVNHSYWDCTLEDGGRAVRLGMRLVKGMREADAAILTRIREKSGGFESIERAWRLGAARASTLLTLAKADGMRSMGLSRQQALWAARALDDRPAPLFDTELPDAKRCETQIVPGMGSGTIGMNDRSAESLPPIPEATDVMRDYQTAGLSLKKHPLAFIRPKLNARRVLTAQQAKDAAVRPHRSLAAVAGVVLFRQRPSTAKGVLFMTLEDETDRFDLILRPWVYERYRAAAIFAHAVIAYGRIERNEGVIHLLATRIEDATGLMGDLTMPGLSRDFR